MGRVTKLRLALVVLVLLCLLITLAGVLVLSSEADPKTPPSRSEIFAADVLRRLGIRCDWRTNVEVRQVTADQEKAVQKARDALDEFERLVREQGGKKSNGSDRDEAP